MKKLIMALIAVASLSAYSKEPWLVNCSYDNFTSKNVQLQLLVNLEQNGKLSCEVYTYNFHPLIGENDIVSYYTIPCSLTYNASKKFFSISDLSKKKKLKAKIYADDSNIKLMEEGDGYFSYDGYSSGKDYKGTIHTGLKEFSDFKREDARCNFYQKP